MLSVLLIILRNSINEVAIGDFANGVKPARRVTALGGNPRDTSPDHPPLEKKLDIACIIH
jgi:hypothetical protein